LEEASPADTDPSIEEMMLMYSGSTIEVKTESGEEGMEDKKTTSSAMSIGTRSNRISSFKRVCVKSVYERKGNISIDSVANGMDKGSQLSGNVSQECPASASSGSGSRNSDAEVGNSGRPKNPFIKSPGSATNATKNGVRSLKINATPNEKKTAKDSKPSAVVEAKARKVISLKKNKVYDSNPDAIIVSK
jgi:hypothetical protein